MTIETDTHTDTPTQTLTERLVERMMNPQRSTIFPVSLYRLLEESTIRGLDDVVSWLPDSQCQITEGGMVTGGGTEQRQRRHLFKVHNPTKFCTTIMPNYFNQTKYKSFLRQLNFYGFERVTCGPHRGSYWHKKFIRGQPDLCHEIKRINATNTVTGPSTTSPKYHRAAITTLDKAMDGSSTTTASSTNALPPNSLINQILAGNNSNLSKPFGTTSWDMNDERETKMNRTFMETTFNPLTRNQVRDGMGYEIDEPYSEPAASLRGSNKMTSGSLTDPKHPLQQTSSECIDQSSSPSFLDDLFLHPTPITSKAKVETTDCDNKIYSSQDIVNDIIDLFGNQSEDAATNTFLDPQPPRQQDNTINISQQPYWEI